MSDINIVLENRDDIRVAVEEKDINVEVPAGKDGRSLRPRGEWSASAAYAYLDLVSYQGSSYAALKAVPAGTLPTDTSYWMLSAEKGEPGGAVWGNISGDLSDQTDLQTALDAKAPVILSNASGSIASFTDGAPLPVTALSVAIEPVQDLHGYDAPWPAGGGKNLFDPSKAEVGKNWNGNAMAYSIVTDYIPVTVGNTYVFSVSNMQKYTGVVTAFFDADKTYVSTGTSTTINPSGNETFVRVSIRCANTDTWTDADLANAKIQIEKGSSATSFAPYSNICPISGHTSAMVTRTGKNLFDPSNGTIGKWISATGEESTNPDGYISSYFKIASNTKYTINENDIAGGYTMILCWYDESYNFLRRDIGYISTISGTPKLPITVTSPQNAKYARAGIYVGSGSITEEWIVARKPQLELGSSASSYEPYQGTSVTIDLDGTRYGGTLNVLTGEMTVDRAIVTLDNTLTESQIVLAVSTDCTQITYSPFNSVGKPQTGFVSNLFADKGTVGGNLFTIWHSSVATAARMFIGIPKSVTTKAEAITWFSSNPTQVVYYLATPLTVTLSPSQMQTLLGTNNIWADTGDVAVTYRADTKLYIEKLTKPTEDDMTANTNISANTFFMVGNSLYYATSAIATGTTIVPGSNCTALSLAEALNNLNA